MFDATSVKLKNGNNFQGKFRIIMLSDSWLVDDKKTVVICDISCYCFTTNLATTAVETALPHF